MSKTVEVYLTSTIVLAIDPGVSIISPEHIRHVILIWQIKCPSSVQHLNIRNQS
ncbi:hypothetical protein ACFL3G_06925 [Planctomycetota bacterium]